MFWALFEFIIVYLYLKFLRTSYSDFPIRTNTIFYFWFYNISQLPVNWDRNYRSTEYQNVFHVLQPSAANEIPPPMQFCTPTRQKRRWTHTEYTFVSLSLSTHTKKKGARVQIETSEKSWESDLQISNANGRNKLWVWALAEPWTRRRTTAGAGRRRRQRRKRNHYNSHRVSWRVSRPLRLRKALLFAFVFWFVLQSKKCIFFVYLILIVKLTINVKFLLEVCLDWLHISSLFFSLQWNYFGSELLWMEKNQPPPLLLLLLSKFYGELKV